MKKINLGVVGVGSMGRNHCRILQMMKDIDFSGVYDINRESCVDIGKKKNVKCFSSYRELLMNVDAVIIAVPTKYHYALTKQAIEQGRHVLVEKPFVTTMEEAEMLISLMEEKKVIVQVGHIERFNPAVEQLLGVVDNGKIISIDARRLGAPGRSIDVDVILDLMIHDIDIILRIANSPPQHILAMGVSQGNEESVDFASVLLSFEQGILANLTASRITQEKIRTLDITESERFIRTNYLTRELYIYRQTDSLITPSHSYRQENLVEKILVPYVEPLFAEVDHFIQAIRDNQYPESGVYDAAKALEVALKIKEKLYLLK